jgi:hypothetical protein
MPATTKMIMAIKENDGGRTIRLEDIQGNTKTAP